jgi:hypothetical protein
MNVRIERDGMFGIGSQYSPWMNFSVHAVDWDKPFLSETGYRSFLGLHAELVPGLTPDTFAIDVICRHVVHNLKGTLRMIEARYLLARKVIGNSARTIRLNYATP